MNQVIDLSTLTWVKKELDETLKEARQSLEAHVDNPQDEAQLAFVAAHLHQVYGTLQMVELYGASLLAEEMESVAKAIAGKTVSKLEDACEVLMRAILQLPDYLDRLIAGSRDIPLVLLPILNDLRSVRGENLLSENAMFSPDINSKLPEHVTANRRNADIQTIAKGLRHKYQLGLLSYLRGSASLDPLKEMADVLMELQESSQTDGVSRLWWVAGGIVASLKANGLEAGVSVNRLFGQVDREIKRLIDDGEAALEQNPALDLFKNLLFYVAQSNADEPQVNSIRDTYRLRELIPDEQEIAEARESMSGQNSDLFSTVAIAVKEELARLKDSLDLVLRNGGKELDDLDPLIESLRSLGDTLGMLSLDAPRKAMLSKAKSLQEYREAGDRPPETLLMDVASTLLFVESSVDGMGAGRGLGDRQNAPDEQLAQSEYDQVMDVVFQEALGDLVRGKDAIIEYIESGHDAKLLEAVPQLFNQVKGGLLLLGEERAAALIGSAARYVENELCNKTEQPESDELDSLADAICGLEYYLEGRREHRMYGGSAISMAEESVGKLGYPALDENDELDSANESTLGEGVSECSDEAVAPGENLDTYDQEENVVSGLEDVQSADSDAVIANGMHVSSDENVHVEADKELQYEDADIAGNVEVESDQSVCDDSSEDQDISSETVKHELDGSHNEPGNQASVQNLEYANSEDAHSKCEISEDSEEDDGLEIIGSDVDEEILEIFIEEAEEEINSIGEQLPRWSGNIEDSDALGTLRRSYHTLKGSGRLVGAMRIGEFAWSFENMLNKVIDGTIEVTTPMLELLESARKALPDLVQQIKDGTPVNYPISYLVRCAEALSKGDPLPVLEAESRVEPETVVDPPFLLETTTLPIDECEADACNTSSDYAERECSTAVEPDGVMDSMLYEIFNTESQGHLEVIRQFLDQFATGNTRVSEDVARSLHTLHGSAHMAKAAAIADLSGELERYAKALIGADMPMPDQGCQALRESAQMIENMLEALPIELREPERFETVVNSIRDLRAAVPVVNAEAQLGIYSDEVPEEDPSETATVEDSMDCATVDEDPYKGCDEELLDIFLEESAENLESSETALSRWKNDPADNESIAELQRAVHTLKGGARMADLIQIGDLSHALETAIASIAEGSTGHGSLGIVQKAHDALASMLENVNNRNPIEARDDLVAELMELAQSGTAANSTDTPNSVQEAESFQMEPSDSTEEDTASPVDPYADADQELLEVFLEEAGDILEHSEETLRAWKNDPANSELMSELQRELHTMKGGARMADITEIGDLAHAVESLMVKVAEGEVSANPGMFSILEQSQDRLNEMIQQVVRREPVSEALVLMNQLEMLHEGKEVPVQDALEEQPELEKVAEQKVERVVAKSDREHQDRRLKARDNQELVRVKARLLDNMVNYAGEVSIYRSRLEQQVGAFRFNLVEMEQTVSRLREQLRKLEIETEAQILFRYETESENPEEQFDPLEMDRYSHMQQLSRSLVESVSDLGSIQSLLENITGESETLLLQQSRVNTELQEGLMRTRMVPFLGLAARMRRIVRQTCQSLGKQAELELSGAEGEMDRTVVDRIIAPIEHMLRNAISHGIELPDVRNANGKPESGTIRITLERESSDVMLKIADDGAGINLAAIRKKAIERGLMQADANYTDTDVLQFILETGFSTAEKVTQVAGRGVGMDVVNSEVKQLGGSLHIDSCEGQGTTFTIRLPFTLALNHALLIEVGEDTYAVPLSSIEGIVRMPRSDLKSYYDDEDVKFSYGGHEYEVRHLGSLLGTGAPHLDSGPKRMPVLLARVGDHCVAFQVENLIGSREIVVKSVGPQISTVRGVSGATILGDGRVVMILDLPAMLRSGMSSPMAQVEEIFNRPVRTKGLTVMVVDDSITVRKVTTRLLERNDMNVIAAKDGVDAVSKLQENIPDIMLLDIEMPRMDGFELATHIRNEQRLRGIPIIMITSRTGDKHRQRAMQIGVNRYLGKPFQETELLENIRDLLGE